LVETAASTFAKGWLETLLGHMDLEGTVTAGGTDGFIRLQVEVNKAGRLIGKRGATLRSIRHLLAGALAKDFGEVRIDFDVDDPNKEERPAREERSASSDRGRGGERGGDRGGDRRGRGRDRGGDRGDRGGDRGGDRSRGRDRDRGGDRGDRGDREKSGLPEEKLRALATRAAEKAIETGKPITINLELSSYDRRLIHVTVADIPGVMTISEESDDGVKRVKVVPELSEG